MSKNHHVVLPEVLIQECREHALKHGGSLVKSVQTMFKRGLLMSKIIDDPKSKLVIIQGETSREIMA